MISISKIFLLRYYKITPSQKLSWPTPPLAENRGDQPFVKATCWPPPPSTFRPAPNNILRKFISYGCRNVAKLDSQIFIR